MAARIKYGAPRSDYGTVVRDCPLEHVDFVAVDAAYERCLLHYRKNLRRYRVGLSATPSINVCRGIGSTLNLFPQTTIGDFRTWAPSKDVAWSQDWYSVGMNLYESLLKFLRTESANAGTAKTDSLDRPSWGRSIEGATRNDSNNSWGSR